MVRLTVNGTAVEVPDGATLLQAGAVRVGRGAHAVRRFGDKSEHGPAHFLDFRRVRPTLHAVGRIA